MIRWSTCWKAIKLRPTSHLTGRWARFPGVFAPNVRRFRTLGAGKEGNSLYLHKNQRIERYETDQVPAAFAGSDDHRDDDAPGLPD